MTAKTGRLEAEGLSHWEFSLDSGVQLNAFCKVREKRENISS